MQSAQTATLVARTPIVFLFFMTHSPVGSKKVVASNARKATQLYLTTVTAKSLNHCAAAKTGVVMSALGQKRTFRTAEVTSVILPEADIRTGD
jgi:hypothetical protein